MKKFLINITIAGLVLIFVICITSVVSAAVTCPTRGSRISCLDGTYVCGNNGGTCRLQSDINRNATLCDGVAPDNSNEQFDCNSCGCVCIEGLVRCDSVCSVPRPQNCRPGQTYDACRGCLGNEIVILNPSPTIYPSGQSGYLSVVGTNATETATPPKGALIFNSDIGKLRVKTGPNVSDWKDVGGANYTAGRNIDIAADNRIATVPDPNFTKLHLGGAPNPPNSGDLALAGDIYLNYGKAFRVDYPGEAQIYMANYNAGGAGLTFNVGGYFSLTESAGFGGHSPNPTWRISAPNLYVGNGRDGGTIIGAGASQNAGDITTDGNLTVRGFSYLNSISATGDVSLNNRANIGKTLYVGSNTLQADRSLITANARYNSFGTGEYLIELLTASETNIPTRRFTVDKNGNLADIANITASGNLALNGTITGATNITASGNLVAGGSLQVNGGITSVGNVAFTNGSTAGNITSRANGGVMRLRVTEGVRSMAFDDASIQTESGDLLLQEFGGNVRAYNDLNVDDNLDIGGVIKAGTYDIQITSPGGGLKMTELANEDFDKTTKGMLTFTVKGSVSCTDVCHDHHGLVCSDVLQLEATGLNPTTLWVGCGDAYSDAFRMCFCKG